MSTNYKVGEPPSSSNPLPVQVGAQAHVFTEVQGSPFALVATWQKVATVTSAASGLRIAPIASASSYDIEWIAVPAGHAAPTNAYGEPIFGGEDFAAGIPLGDLYLKSVSAQVAIVKMGI